MALAGGVSIPLPQKRGYSHAKKRDHVTGRSLPGVRCAPEGTVFSNGLGIVVLRRLSDAIAANDRIYAVIKGAALNNDGSAKVSFTAPSVEGHAQVIATAQALAGIDPDTISYIEAHGTGTTLGDPIEIAGLTQAFRAGGAVGNGSCAIGALKTNTGHLDAAAYQNLVIAWRCTAATWAALHFQAPNPKLDLDNTPFVERAIRPGRRRPSSPRRRGLRCRRDQRPSCSEARGRGRQPGAPATSSSCRPDASRSRGTARPPGGTPGGDKP
jgi:acyl transferase domain-containing protein